MRRLAVLALAAVLLLCACGENTQPIAGEIERAVGALAAKTAFGGDYLLEISVSGESKTTLYYAKGVFGRDSAAKTAYTSFDQSWFGMSAVSENYYSDGRIVSINDGEVITAEREPDDVFLKFPYSAPEGYGSSCRGLSAEPNTRGKAVMFTRGGSSEFCESVVGGDLYTLAYVIKDPQPEKTVYGDVKCIYTLSGGELISAGYEFDVTLFDTPSYVPGYSQPEEDYSIKLHVVAKVNYSDEYEIKEYSGEE